MAGRSTKKFYLARLVNGPLRMNKGLMSHILKDRWNNSENPRRKGHHVSNDSKEDDRVSRGNRMYRGSEAWWA